MHRIESKKNVSYHLQKQRHHPRVSEVRSPRKELRPWPDSSLEIGEILFETLFPNNVQFVFYEIIYRNSMLLLYRVILYLDICYKFCKI